MTKKYLDENALLYFIQRLKNTFAQKDDLPDAGLDEDAVLQIVQRALQEADMGFLKYQGVVDTYADLPTDLTDDNNGWLYAVSDGGGEYYWLGGKWNALDFDVDLSEYWAKDELSVMTNTDVSDAFTAAGL